MVSFPFEIPESNILGGTQSTYTDFTFLHSLSPKPLSLVQSDLCKLHPTPSGCDNLVPMVRPNMLCIILVIGLIPWQCPWVPWIPMISYEMILSRTPLYFFALVINLYFNVFKGCNWYIKPVMSQISLLSVSVWVPALKWDNWES